MNRKIVKKLSSMVSKKQIVDHMLETQLRVELVKKGKEYPFHISEDEQERLSFLWSQDPERSRGALLKIIWNRMPLIPVIPPSKMKEWGNNKQSRWMDQR